MELQKKYIGSKVYIKKLSREVEICEENILTLLANNFRHLFVMPKPIKTKKVDSPKPVSKQRSKDRVDTDTSKS